jgi:formyl-CoA transferase
VRERTGNELGASVPAGMFSSGDGKWMVLTTSTDRTFRRLTKLMGRADMVDDPRYSTNRARVKRREEVHGVVADWFASMPAEEIQRLCDEYGVPVSVAYNAADIFRDPQYAARDMLVEVEHPTFGSITVPGVVPKFSKTEGAVRGVGPTLGQHNAEVYGGLGLSEEDIKGLEEEGVI